MNSVARQSASFERQNASFRDPSGYIFFQDGRLSRAVTPYGLSSYRTLMDAGLYDELVKRELLISHREVAQPTNPAMPLRLEPELLSPVSREAFSVITYPNEWSFSQLQDAALLTLQIQTIAIEKGASLKDATPYNVQFRSGRPVFMDTLSFDPFQEKPWVAYRQFCEMFLAPLALMATREADFNRYLLVDLGGMRLPTVSRLLPWSTRLNPGLLAHIHLHAMGQKKLEGSAVSSVSMKMPKLQQLALLDQLQGLVRGLKPFRSRTSFGAYYAECAHYTDAADAFKVQAIRDWVTRQNAGPDKVYRTAVDLGANNGKYSRLLTGAGIGTLSVDSDPYCVDENYKMSRDQKDGRMLPLVVDLSNLSGGSGWSAREREPLFAMTPSSGRFRPDLVLSLALIHHLRISAGVSMEFLASFFGRLAGKDLILEFVPKADPMVAHLLKTREDIFNDYDEASFEEAFGRYFDALDKPRLPESPRRLYFLRNKSAR